MNVETATPAEVFASLHLDATVTWCNTSATMTRAGREYRIVATSSRATLHACNSAPEANDGYEVARAYAAPGYAIPLLLSKIPA